MIKNICLQIPKVGSSSIHDFIGELHNIDLKNMISLPLPVKFDYNVIKNESFSLHVHDYIDLPAELISDIKNGLKINIISLIRDPIGRNISGMFFDRLGPNSILPSSLYFPLKNNFDKMNIYLYNYTQNKVFINWFENYFNPLVGFNVYDLDFDKVSGYSIYNNGNINILLLKLEKLNDNYKEAFSNFYGFNIKISMNSSNVQKNEFYNEYKKQTKLSKEYVNSMYDNKYVKHFYTDYEINKFKEKWL